MGLNIGLSDQHRMGVIGSSTFCWLMSMSCTRIPETIIGTWSIPSSMISISFLNPNMKKLNEVVDEVVERVRALGGQPWAAYRVSEADEAEGTSGAICETLEMVKNLIIAMRRLFSRCVWIWNAVPISFTTWAPMTS